MVSKTNLLWKKLGTQRIHAHFFFKFIGLSILFLWLSSCEKENIFDSKGNQSSAQNNYTIKILHGKDAVEDENILRAVEKYERNAPGNLLGRGVHNSEQKFTINTNVIRYIQNTGTGEYSYTFNVAMDEPTDKVENIVFSFSKDSTYKAVLVSYDLTQNDIEALKNHKSVDYTGKVDYEFIEVDFPLEGESGKVYWTSDNCITVVNEYCSYGNHSGGIENGEHCPGYTIEYLIICSPLGGGGPDTGYNGNPNPGPGDDAGPPPSSGGSGGSGTTPTAPILDIDYQQMLLDCITPSVDDDWPGDPLSGNGEENNWGAWLYQDDDNDDQPDNFLEIRDLANFLADNECSEEAQAFGEMAAQAFANDGEVDFDDKIINELTGKADCIYQKLKDNSTSFRDAVQKFDGEFPVGHLKFSINNNLPTGNYGVTSPPDNYLLSIEMSNTQLNNISDLGGAVAFVHEVIHAEIFRKMMEAAQTGSLDPQNMTQQQQIDYVNSLRENFPGIYDYYIDRYKPTWNHNMMAQHYIDVIADAIEEFDNFQFSRQVYEDISWAGLRVLEDLNNSVAWDNLSSLDQQRILNNMNQYFFNGTSNCN